MDGKNKLEVYEENIETIKSTNLFLWESLKEEIVYQDNVYMDKSVKGEDIIAIEKEGHMWYLNSRYDAEYAASIWAEPVSDINYASVIIVFGFGTGVYLKKLREQYPKNIILVYEPSHELFDMVLKSIDIQEIFKDEKLFICVGEVGKRFFAEYMLLFITYSNFSHVIWKQVPNYESIFNKEYLEIQIIYMSWIRSIKISENTRLFLGEKSAINCLQNLWDCLNGYSLKMLKEKIQETIDVEQYPAIIVSAGPSLDKNIGQLKKAIGKSYIIAVDTALKTVIRAGIIPNLAVTIDPNKDIVLFEDKKISALPIVVGIKSNSEIIKKHYGKKFYYKNPYSYIEDIHQQYGKETVLLETGGSVANDAFSTAVFMGFKKIILIGQDLAYPDKKEHTKDAYDDTAGNIINTSKKNYFKVEDIYGEMIWTRTDMDSFRKWFERQIIRYSELKVIDATEGGAKIQGTEIISLEQVIERECEHLEVVDFNKIMDELVPHFTAEELEQVKKQLFNIPNELNVIKEVLEKGFMQYDELENLAKNGLSNTEKIEELINEIKKTTDWLEEKTEMKLVNMYSFTAENQLKNKLFDIQKELKDEIIVIAQNGKEMIESYFKAMEELENNLEILYQNM